MDNSKDVYILGAGFSKNFDLPLVREIFSDGYKKLVNRFPHFDQEFRKEWLRLIGGSLHAEINYEEMLSRIDLDPLVVKRVKNLCAHQRHKELIHQVNGFNEYLNEFEKYNAV